MGTRELQTWQVFRPAPSDDGVGGQTVTMTQVGTERGDVRELVGRERFTLQGGGAFEAGQSGAEHTHRGWFRVRANIRRGDQLVRDDERLTVTSTTSTFPETRLQVLAKTLEAGG